MHSFDDIRHYQPITLEKYLAAFIPYDQSRFAHRQQTTASPTKEGNSIDPEFCIAYWKTANQPVHQSTHTTPNKRNSTQRSLPYPHIVSNEMKITVKTNYQHSSNKNQPTLWDALTIIIEWTHTAHRTSSSKISFLHHNNFAFFFCLFVSSAIQFPW